MTKDPVLKNQLKDSGLCWSIFLYIFRKSMMHFTQFLSCVWLFAVPLTVAHQASLSMGWARILEWAAMPSSRGSSWSRDWSHVSCVGRWILYHWVTGEVPSNPNCLLKAPQAMLALRRRTSNMWILKGHDAQPITISIYPLPIYRLSVCIRLFLSSFCQSREQFQIFIHNKEELHEHACIL